MLTGENRVIGRSCGPLNQTLEGWDRIQNFPRTNSGQNNSTKINLLLQSIQASSQHFEKRTINKGLLCPVSDVPYVSGIPDSGPGTHI